MLQSLSVNEKDRRLHVPYVMLRGMRYGTYDSCNTNSGQRVSEYRRVELCVAAAPPSGGHAHLLFTSRRPKSVSGNSSKCQSLPTPQEAPPGSPA